MRSLAIFFKRTTLYFLIIIILLFHLIVPAAYCGWIADIYGPHDKVPNYVGIRYYADDAKGYKTIKGALVEISSKGILKHLIGINISELLRGNAVFQKEIFTELRLNRFTELNAALQSSGNIHNPKIRALYDHFAQAVLQTATIKRINTELESFGLGIFEASPEKLTIIETNGEKNFDAILYLNVGRK